MKEYPISICPKNVLFFGQITDPCPHASRRLAEQHRHEDRTARATQSARRRLHAGHVRGRLFYGFPGRRLVGYDNERGKGDHRHAGAREERYAFTSLERLFDDFIADVDARRNE